MNPVTRGALAGLAGTVVMSAAMLTMKKAGMIPGELEPREIAGNLEEITGVRHRLPKGAFEASWAMLHFGYGLTSGAAYALAREKIPDPGRPAQIGAPFGLLLWVLGYCGWLPLSGLYPPPNRLPKRKVAANVVAHAVYGTATAAMHGMLHSSPQP
jgi:uncharacterized membrane protein YagU involved in acid resistance